jgi:release factor glutamine methyltransferase
MTDAATDSDESAPPTRQALLDRARRRLADADRQAPRRTAEWLLTEVLGVDRGRLYARSDRPVPPDAAARFGAMVDRCVAGEPLQHVLGHTSFRGLRIEVSPAVMIPRPETEEVVSAALAAVADRAAPRVLDVGTGSGCIALALKHERPDAAVEAWDVSPDALAVARDNARRLGVDVTVAMVDVLEDERAPEIGAVDLLVSNPPYIPDAEADALPPVVREYDPPEALFAGPDPLRFYRALAARVPTLCAAGAAVVFETHADHAEAAAGVLRDAGLVDVQVDTDLSDRPRILTARWPGPDAAPGGRAGATAQS